MTLLVRLTAALAKRAQLNKIGAGVSCVDNAGATRTDCTIAGGGASLPVVDTTSIAEGSADATKEVRFEVDGLTTATVRVLTMANENIDLTPGTGSFATEAEGNLAATALQSEINDLYVIVTWANVPDANLNGANERDEVCGTTENVEGHHDDLVSKPLDLRWLCNWPPDADSESGPRSGRGPMWVG